MSNEGSLAPDHAGAEPAPGTPGWTRRAVIGTAAGAVAAGGIVAATSGGAISGTRAAQAATMLTKHGMKPRGEDAAAAPGAAEGRFGYMFKKLKGFTPDESLLSDLAKWMTETRPPSSTLDNKTVTAGYTFFGQFVDHDMTLDRRALTGSPTDEKGVNFDSPKFDLQSVYGKGPDPKSPQAHLYESDGKRLRLGNYYAEDLPRDEGNWTALCGDARNDENLIITQFHLLFLKFHNRLLEDKKASTFAEAQRITQWHFQWMIVNEFLKRVLDRDIFETVKANPKKKGQFFNPKSPQKPEIPLEYSGAAFRFGHSMVRGAYVLNSASGAVLTFPDLHGSQRLPANKVIEWERFFSSDPKKQRNMARVIDPRLATPLFTLPPTVVNDGVVSLAQRNLRRGRQLNLPSGQAVAREMLGEVPGLKVHTNEEFAVSVENAGQTDLAKVLRKPEWRAELPLWFYVLAEPMLDPANGGQTLGKLGSTIVGEVIMCILNGDKDSYLNAKSGFTPMTGRNEFTVMNFADYAQGKVDY